MGIDALRDAIEAEARSQIATVLDEARATAEALRAEAAEKASTRLQQALSLEEARLRAATAARIAGARSMAQTRVLKAREALLDRVFALARDGLSELLDDPTAQEAMVGLAVQALGHIPSDQVVVTCSSEMEDALSDALSPREGLRIERDDEMPCGFRVRDREGSVTVDATLAKLLELRRPMLAIEVLKHLGEP